MVVFKPSRCSLGHARLGLSISKKVGKAYRRNRLKRLSREFFRHSELSLLPLDLLVVVSSRLDKHKFGPEHSEAQLLSSLKKLEDFLKRRF